MSPLPKDLVCTSSVISKHSVNNEAILLAIDELYVMLTLVLCFTTLLIENVPFVTGRCPIPNRLR